MSIRRRQPKRRRKVPRNIAEKTDREIMETVFGKRVMKATDRGLAEWREKHPPPVPEHRATTDNVST